MKDHPGCSLCSLPLLHPTMAEEKEKTEFEDTPSDPDITGESGDAIDEKQLLRKLDWHLIPAPTLLLLLSFMDRSNGEHIPLLILLSFIFFQSGMLVSRASLWIYT